MTHVLNIVIKNASTLFEDLNSSEEHKNSATNAIENPPVFEDMVPLPPYYSNKVIFPKEVHDEKALIPENFWL